jgi:hypothetical protein
MFLREALLDIQTRSIRESGIKQTESEDPEIVVKSF